MTWRLWTTATRRRSNRFLRVPRGSGRGGPASGRRGPGHARPGRARAGLPGRVVRRRWRSSARSCSSGWMLTLRPAALEVQRCRSGQAAQASFGSGPPVLPGSNGMATPAGQVSCPALKSRVNWSLANRPEAFGDPPGLAEDHQVRAAVADQGRGQVGPVDMQLGQGPPGCVQVGGDIAGDAGLRRVGRGDPDRGDQPGRSRSRSRCRL